MFQHSYITYKKKRNIEKSPKCKLNTTKCTNPVSPFCPTPANTNCCAGLSFIPFENIIKCCNINDKSHVLKLTKIRDPLTEFV